MTPAEVADLLAFAAAFDRRTVGRADVLAWHTVLADVDHTQARDAVSAHYADQTRWIMPADIRQAVRERRSQAAADYVGPGLTAEVPDADPDDVPGYIAALRAGRARAASGLERPRPVAALVDGRADRSKIPTPRRPPGPMSIVCPRCTAPLGIGCRLPSGRPRAAGPHRERATAAQRRWEAAS